MNLHTHRMSAQGGGGAAAVPVLNGSSNSNPQIQASGGGHVNLEPDYVSARRFMTTKM